MKPIHLLGLIVLGAVWGASFMFINVAAPVLGPFFLMGLRVLLAGAALLLYAYAIGNMPNIRARWRSFLFVGAVNAAIPFTLIALSNLTLTASLTSILNSTTPLFTALVVAVWVRKPPRALQAVGLLMGIAGVAILVGGSPLSVDADKIIAVLASLGAALCYAIGTVFASKRFEGVSGLHLAIGQLFGASAVMLIPTALSPPQGDITLAVIGSFLMVTFVSTSLAYLLYFYLLRNIGPTRTSSVTFLVPVFGTLWGVLLLGDQLTAGVIVGMVIILASVGLVNST